MNRVRVRIRVRRREIGGKKGRHWDMLRLLFNLLVGLATIISCWITWRGLNRGIHQIANNVSQLFYEIRPVMEKYQNEVNPSLPLRDTIVIIHRDTIVNVRKDTVIVWQQIPEKESGYNLPKEIRKGIDDEAIKFKQENFQ